MRDRIMATGRRMRIFRRVALISLLVILIFAVLASMWMLSRSRDMQLFGKLVARVDTDQKVVALTFDDGPTPAYTSGVLQQLRDTGVRATFFLTGAEIEQNPDEARAILASGHELANHSYSHPDMTLAGVERARREVETTDTALRAVGVEGDILFRPPYGKKLIGLPLYLSQNDRTTIMWDVEPESHPEIAADPDLIARHVLDNTKPGSIIILHVMYPAREASRAALPAIIEGLHARGYRFVTVTELLQLQR